MISEFFLDIIFNLVSGMLSAAPDITFSVETSAFQYFVDILKVAYEFDVLTAMKYGAEPRSDIAAYQFLSGVGKYEFLRFSRIF